MIALITHLRGAVTVQVDRILRLLRFPNILTRAYLRALYDYRVHGVDSTYLMGPIGAVVPQRLATLHRECVMGTASLTMSASTVNVNSTVTASINVFNQNANPLTGRKQVIGYDASLFQALDSTTFHALTPRTGDIQFNVNVDNRISLEESVRIPLVTVAQASYTETDYDGGWEVVFSSNGDQDSPPPTTAPTTRWDGSEGSCTARVRKPSTGTAFEEWQLRFCARSYAVAGVSDSLVSGTHVTVVPIWRDATGAQVGAGCDEHRCISSLQVELYDDIGELVGRSSVIGIGGSAARIPIEASGIRPVVTPNASEGRTVNSGRRNAAGPSKDARLPIPARVP